MGQSRLLDEQVPDLLSLLGKEARVVAARMKEKGDDVVIAPLRQLEHWCNRYLALSTDSSEQFSMFFLATFIRDIFFNLAGDVRYDEATQACKRDYFLVLAEQVAQVGNALVNQRGSDLSSTFHSMVGSYINAVKKMNQTTLEKEGASNGRDGRPKEHP